MADKLTVLFLAALGVAGVEAERKIVDTMSETVTMHLNWYVVHNWQHPFFVFDVRWQHPYVAATTCNLTLRVVYCSLKKYTSTGT